MIKILKASKSKEEFKEFFYNHLVETEFVPAEIFSGMNIVETKEVTVPMWHYVMTFRSKWECKERDHSWGDDDDDNWTWRSGVATGVLNVLRLATESANVPEVIAKAFAKPVEYKAELTDLLEDAEPAGQWAITESKTLLTDAVMEAYKEDKVQEIGKQNAPRDRKRFSAKGEFDAPMIVERIDMTYYLVRYEYQGKEYYYITDGQGVSEYSAEPVAKGEKGKARTLKVANWSVVIGMILIAAIMVCCGMIFPAILVIILGFVGVYFIAKASKKVQEGAKAARAAALAKFKGTAVIALLLALSPLSSQAQTREMVEGYDLAVEMIANCEYAGAMHILGEIVQEDPAAFEPAYQLLRVLSLSGQFDYALELADAMCEVHKVNASVFNLRANIRFFTGDYIGALNDNNRAISINPSSPILYYRRGRCQDALGNHGRACEDYAKVLEIEQEFNEAGGDWSGGDACGHLACLFMGDVDTAFDIIDQLTDISPDYYYDAACMFSLIGETEAALNCIILAADNGFCSEGLLMYDPDLENLRDSAEFAAWLAED